MVDILHAAWGLESAGGPSDVVFPKDKDWGFYKDTTSGAMYMVYNDGGTVRKLPSGNPWQVLSPVGTTLSFDVSAGSSAFILEPFSDASYTLATPLNSFDGDRGFLLVNGGATAAYPTLASGWAVGENNGGVPIALPSLPTDPLECIMLEWVRAADTFYLWAVEDHLWPIPVYGLEKIPSAVVYWDPKDTSTIRSASVHDDGTADNTGSLSGAAANPYVSDVPSGSWNDIAIQLDGSTVYIDLTSFATLGQYTYAGWFKYSGSGALTLLGQDGAVTNLISVTSDTNVRVQPAGTALDFTVASMTAGWHFLAVTRDGSNNVRVYVDGTQSTTGAQIEAGELTLDAFGNSNASLSAVTLSDWRYYTSELSSDNLTYLQTFGASGSAPGSEVNLWPMDGAVENSDACMVWVDKINGIELYQFTAADMPTYDATNKCFTYDGISKHWQADDTNTLSFTAGSPDSPLTFASWVNPIDATNFWVFSKSSGSNREYVFGLNGSDQLQSGMNNTTSANTIRCISDVAVTESVWTAILSTYDGGGVETGMDNYEDNVDVADTTSELGTYTNMINTTAPFYVGVIGGGASYANGKIGALAIFNTVLTEAERRLVYNFGAPNWS